MPKIIPLGPIDPTLYGIAKRRATMMENGTMSFVGAFENELGRIVFKKVGDVVHAIVRAGGFVSNLVGYAATTGADNYYEVGLKNTVSVDVQAGGGVFQQFTMDDGGEKAVNVAYTKNGHYFVAPVNNLFQPAANSEVAYGVIDSGESSVLALPRGNVTASSSSGAGFTISSAVYENYGRVDVDGRYGPIAAMIEQRLSGGESDAFFAGSSPNFVWVRHVNRNLTGTLNVRTFGDGGLVNHDLGSWTSAISRTESQFGVVGTTEGKEILASGVVTTASGVAVVCTWEIHYTPDDGQPPGAKFFVRAIDAAGVHDVGIQRPLATSQIWVAGSATNSRTIAVVTLPGGSSIAAKLLAIDAVDGVYTSRLIDLPPPAINNEEPWTVYFLANNKAYGHTYNEVTGQASFITDLEDGTTTVNTLKSNANTYYAHKNGQTYIVGADRLVPISPAKYLTGVPAIDPPATGKPYRLKR